MRVLADDVVRWCQGELVAGDGRTAIESFVNDSRQVVAGACFVALRAERDGHDFVADAFAGGAVAALVARHVECPPGRVLIVHADPLEALARAARGARGELLRDVPVVAVTGSTGKTSTKDLLTGALATLRVHANVASFNNEIGLPLTLLNAPATAGVIVTEMGARFAGNIRDLCAIARPVIGVITNVGSAHSEHLGDVRAVAEVKGELIEALPDDGVAVLPADDPSCRRLVERAGRRRVITFGRDQSAVVRITDVVVDDELRPTVTIMSPWGMLRATLQLRGAHQSANAAAAAAVAWQLGLPADAIAAGLEQATGSAWRMELLHTPSGIAVLNDSYNANPASMQAALAALARAGGSNLARTRIAVLGAMRELGDETERAHEQVGEQLAALGITRLIAVGDEGRWIARGAAGVCVDTAADASSALEIVRQVAGPGDVVLVKASRAVGLDLVAAALLSETASA